MRYIIRLAAVGALLLLLAVPALAQGRLILEDPGGRLNESAVTQAARPLLNKGATVAVYVVDNGGADDFTERLIDDGLARADGAFLTNVIAIYVAVDDRYSSIDFGNDWNNALDVNDNYEVIRNGELNPGLAAGDFTRGITTALGAIDDAIENPPVPGGGTTIFAPGALVPVAAAGVGLAAAGAGGALLVNRRRVAKARANAQGRLKAAREGAGALIADLGRRFKDAAEKAKFDKVSYSVDEVARLQQLQQQATAGFVKVQEQFDDTGEQLNRYEKPTNEQLLTAAGQYDQVKAGGETVSQELATVEQHRAELDQQLRTAREELDRAKKV